MYDTYRNKFRQRCLDRWDNSLGSLLVSATYNKVNFAVGVVRMEVESRGSSDLNILTLEEDRRLFEELVLYLLAKR